MRKKRLAFFIRAAVVVLVGMIVFAVAFDVVASIDKGATTPIPGTHALDAFRETVALRPMPEGTVKLFLISNEFSVSTKLLGLTPGSTQTLIFHQGSCDATGPEAGTLTADVPENGILVLANAPVRLGAGWESARSVTVRDASNGEPIARACADFGVPDFLQSGGQDASAVLPARPVASGTLVLRGDNSIQIRLAIDGLAGPESYQAQLQDGYCGFGGATLGRRSSFAYSGHWETVEVRFDSSPDFGSHLGHGIVSLAIYSAGRLIACGEVQSNTGSPPGGSSSAAKPGTDAGSFPREAVPPSP